MKKVLVLSKDAHIFQMCKECVLNYECVSVENFTDFNTEKIFDLFDKIKPILVLVDFSDIVQEGFVLLEKLIAKSFAKIIIVSNITNEYFVVKAIKMGIYDYISLPCSKSAFKNRLDSIINFIEIRESYLSENLKIVNKVLGIHSDIQKIKEDILAFATTDLPVIIHGESGTGKSLIARIIHELSPRNKKTFYHENCARFQEALVESQLFGTVPGAFTDAKNTVGIFELCNGGTLFLDEVAEMDTRIQAKFLSVLETKKYSKLGSNEQLQTDFRLICATNADLKNAIMEKTFRSDLFFRISALELYITPLRKRKEDIIILAEHFIKDSNKTFSSGAIRKLLSHQYPGNVRELENIISVANALCKGNLIDEEHIRFSDISMF